MDWLHTEGRALLWQAYPNGYLAMRGVLTVGGFSVDGVEDYGRMRVRFTQGNNGGISLDRNRGDFFDNTGKFTNAGAWSCFQNGDLLPLPNSDDPATWYCLLSDLAHAPGGQGPVPTDRGPCSFLWYLDVGGQWILRATAMTRETGRLPFTRDRVFNIMDATGQALRDPVEALVRARIQLR